MSRKLTDTKRFQFIYCTTLICWILLNHSKRIQKYEIKSSLSFYFLLRLMYLLAFFFLLVSPWQMEFPGQGSFKLHCSCDSITPLTLCAWSGIELASWHCRDTMEPVAPQWELLEAHAFSSISRIFFLTQCHKDFFLFSKELIDLLPILRSHHFLGLTLYMV